MFDGVVSDYSGWFSCRAQEDESWNINNSTHFLVTKSWHFAVSLLRARVDPELSAPPRPSGRRTNLPDVEVRCWSADLDMTGVFFHFCSFCYLFVYVPVGFIQISVGLWRKYPLLDGWLSFFSLYESIRWIKSNELKSKNASVWICLSISDQEYICDDTKELRPLENACLIFASIFDAHPYPLYPEGPQGILNVIECYGGVMGPS